MNGIKQHGLSNLFIWAGCINDWWTCLLLLILNGGMGLVIIVASWTIIAGLCWAFKRWTQIVMGLFSYQLTSYKCWILCMMTCYKCWYVCNRYYGLAYVGQLFRAYSFAYLGFYHFHFRIVSLLLSFGVSLSLGLYPGNPNCLSL
jgi:hypothetical protein